MDTFLELMKLYGTQLSALGAAMAFMFAVYKYQSDSRASRFWKEFEAYHKLVKELVEPKADGGAMYVDRQTAAIYELRFYKRYFPHSLRMLKGLSEKWCKVPDQYPRLLEELDLTIEFLEGEVNRTKT